MILQKLGAITRVLGVAAGGPGVTREGGPGVTPSASASPLATNGRCTSFPLSLYRRSVGSGSRVWKTVNYNSIKSTH